jgi:hypothetical protein
MAVRDPQSEELGHDASFRILSVHYSSTTLLFDGMSPSDVKHKKVTVTVKRNRIVATRRS